MTEKLQVEKLSVSQLKVELKNRKLSVTGTKSVLSQRLSDALGNTEIEVTATETKKITKRKATKKKEDEEESADSGEEGMEPATKKVKTSESDFSIPEHKADEWKIATWNVASFTTIQSKGFAEYLKNENPDIICINETKVNENTVGKFKYPGYYAYLSSCTYNPGYSGTGLYSKVQPISVVKGIGIEEHDKEGRVITAEFDKFYVVATYIPNAGEKDKATGLPKSLDYRMEWDKAFQQYCHDLDKKKPIVWCGDLNVAHLEIDLKNPKTNRKTAGFTDQERKSFGNFLESGFVDSYRLLQPTQTGAYSFWSYRHNARANNTGWRLDYFVVSKRIAPLITQSYMRSSVMGSDHCPIVLHLKKE